MNQDKYYWDIARQKYVAYFKDTQEIKIVEKEQIKRDIFSQDKNNWKVIKDILFLDDEIIKSRYFIFSPHKPEEWEANGHIYKNTYIQTEVQQKAQEKLKEGILTQNSNFDFMSNYPHIDALIKNLVPIKEQREYFLNWLSYILATNKKTRTAILLRGIPGTGKGVFWEQIISYYYGNFKLVLENDSLKSNFTPKGLDRVMFVLCNEIKGDFRDGNAMYEKLKMYITDDTIRIEEKGVQAYEIKNYFNTILFSNNKTPLQIQGGDRRYSIFSTRARQLRTVANEDFKETEVQFIEKIQSERDNFLIDLASYQYDRVKATTCMETEEKEAIYRASMTKIEILADKVRNLDENYLVNELVEIAEGTENIEELFESARVTLYYKNDKLDIEKTLSELYIELRNSLIENAYCRSATLILYYRLFVERNADMAKIGTKLTEHIGVTNKNGKINGQTVRVRIVKEFKDKKYVNKFIPF